MPKKELAYYEALPYRVDLYFDQEDHVWIARYPELPGCLAHGNTQEEAIINGEEVKSLWLETAIESGDVPPEPQPEPSYSGKLVLRLPKTLHERAAQAAEREGVSLNQYLISAIADRLGAQDLFNRLVEKLQRPAVQFFSVMASSTANLSSIGLEVGTLENIKVLNLAAFPPYPFLPSPPISHQQTQPEERHGGS